MYPTSYGKHLFPELLECFKKKTRVNPNVISPKQLTNNICECDFERLNFGYARSLVSFPTNMKPVVNVIISHVYYSRLNYYDMNEHKMVSWV